MAKKPKPVWIPLPGPVESIWHQQGGTYLLVIIDGRSYRVDTDGTVTGPQPEAL